MGIANCKILNPKNAILSFYIRIKKGEVEISEPLSDY